MNHGKDNWMIDVTEMIKQLYDFLWSEITIRPIIFSYGCREQSFMQRFMNILHFIHKLKEAFHNCCFYGQGCWRVRAILLYIGTSFCQPFLISPNMAWRK